MTDLTDPTPAVHRYAPQGSARELFSIRDPEVLLSGPAGTGKSRACLEKLHAMAMRNPGMRGLICRKTAASLGSTALVTFKDIVAAEALASGEVRFYHGSAQEAACYRYGNGSVIVVGGMDKSTRIMSSEYDVVYAQEATELTQNDWEALTTRLRNGKVSFQQLLADCNPAQPQHWLKRRADSGQTKILYCTHEDNPRLWRDGEWTTEGKSYISKLESLTGVRYLRLRHGKWAAAEGLVYDTFNPEIHVIPYRERGFPYQWTRYWSIDFGFTNPMVVQMWVEDPDGRLYLSKELYMSQRLVEDHAQDIWHAFRHRGMGKREPDPQAIICDWDAEGRATLEKALDLPTVQADKAVLEGIEAVKSRLKVAEDGKPRLFFCNDAPFKRDPVMVDSKRPSSTLEEMYEYTWDVKTVKERPLKVNDHGMDAMRYMVAYLDLKGGAPRVRWL